MASFAELDISNRVLRVLKACTQDAINNGGEGSEQAANHFATVCPLSYEGVRWVQTFFSGSQRRRFATIGGYYDVTRDAFITEQPFDSWKLDEKGDWKAPVKYPSIGIEQPISEGNTYLVFMLRWDENNQKWLCSDRDGGEYEWNSSSKSWIKII